MLSNPTPPPYDAAPHANAANAEEFVAVPRIHLTYLLSHIRAEQARFPARRLHQSMKMVQRMLGELPEKRRG